MKSVFLRPVRNHKLAAWRSHTEKDAQPAPSLPAIATQVPDVSENAVSDVKHS